MMLERDPAFLIPENTELSLPPIAVSLGLGRLSGLWVPTKEPNLVKDLDDQLWRKDRPWKKSGVEEAELTSY